MKIQIFKTAILLVVTLCINTYYSHGQSFSTSTLTFSNDTVADKASKCVVDGLGNSFWATRFYISQTTRTGYMLWKLNKNGVVQNKIVISTNVTGATIQPIKDLKLISGNLYLLFDIKKSGTFPDMDVCTQKYDQSLVKKWESIYNHPNSKNDFANSICEGPKSGIVVTILSAEDGAVVNYSRSTGSIINSYVYSNGNTTREKINKAVLSASSIYIAGRNELISTGNSDMFIARLDSNLSPLWNMIFDASAVSDFDEITDINADATGDILVCGNFTSSIGTSRVFYTKYNDTNGSRLWTRRLTNDEISSVSVYPDASNNLISIVNGNPCRYVNINGSTGTIIASKGIFNVGTVNYAATTCIASGDDLYVTGNYDSTYTLSGNTISEQGVVVTKLSLTGARLWNEKITVTGGNPVFEASDICIRGTNRLYFISNVTDITNPAKSTYSTFSSISTSTGNRIAADASTSLDLHVFPNPAKDLLMIRMNKNIDTESIVEIYNYTGQLVFRRTTTFPSQESVETIDISGLAKGTYVIRLQSGNEQFTQRFIAE